MAGWRRGPLCLFLTRRSRAFSRKLVSVGSHITTEERKAPSGSPSEQDLNLHVPKLGSLRRLIHSLST